MRQVRGSLLRVTKMVWDQRGTGLHKALPIIRPLYFLVFAMAARTPSHPTYAVAVMAACFLVRPVNPNWLPHLCACACACVSVLVSVSEVLVVFVSEIFSRFLLTEISGATDSLCRRRCHAGS